jgi:hypothetical protein
MTTSPHGLKAEPRWRRWLIFLPWVAGALLYALLAGMVHPRVVHPHFLPVVGVLALLVFSSGLAMLVGLWRLLRGPRRLHGLRLVTVATLPLALVAFHGAWANSLAIAELRFADYRVRILFPLVQSLMDLEARFRYPERTVGRKVVMIHAGMPDAQEQVEAMDRHVERMEQLLGHEVTGKVHWVRGGLFGRGGVCFWGIALGGQPGDRPRGPDGLTSLDRHEVAHGVIDSFIKPYQAPLVPILVEGWAESQSGYRRSSLYGGAAQSREENSWVPLKELLLPGREDFGLRIYTQGGVLVNYLLSRYGGPSFIAFYHDCTANTFESDCRRQLGLDLDELETACTQHLDKINAAHHPLVQWRLEEIPCAPGVDPGKWQAFVRSYGATLQPARELSARFTVLVNSKSPGPPLQEDDWQIAFALSGPFAYRMEKGSATQSISLADPSACWQIRRTGPEQPWVAEARSAASGSAYFSLLGWLRRDVADWLKPSGLNANFWGLVDADLATVTELAQFEEGGKLRLRLTIELPPRRPGLPRRKTMILAVDQAFAPLRTEEQIIFTHEATTRIRWEYQATERQPVLRKQFGDVMGPDGQLVRAFSAVIKDFKFGPIPPDQFTLESLGVNESEIMQPADADSSAATQTSWQKRLPRWLAGWLLCCLLTGGFLTWLAFRAQRA